MGNIAGENQGICNPVAISGDGRRSNPGCSNLRLLAALATGLISFVLLTLSFAHNCEDMGAYLIEGGVPIAAASLSALAVLCIRRFWIGLALAAGLVTVVVQAIGPWYVAWAHNH